MRQRFCEDFTVHITNSYFVFPQEEVLEFLSINFYLPSFFMQYSSRDHRFIYRMRVVVGCNRAIHEYLPAVGYLIKRILQFIRINIMYSFFIIFYLPFCFAVEMTLELLVQMSSILLLLHCAAL